MSSLYQTPEGQQSLKMRPACDRVLSDVFNIPKSAIIRYEAESGPHVLDQEFAIDLKICLSCGAQLSGQEKALSNHFYFFKTFTIEFYQNRYTKEPGEFFKIASQFYLSGYSDKSGVEFIEWHIIKLFDFMNWVREVPIHRLESRCKPSKGSRANFLPVPYDKIPLSLFYSGGGGPGTTRVYGDLSSLKTA